MRLDRTGRKRRIKINDIPKHGDNINWQGWGINEIKNILDELNRVGEKPTVRGVWYILVSKFPKWVINTKSIYQSYDKATVKARNGVFGYPRIADDAFSDDTRYILDIDSDSFVRGLDVADGVIKSVKDARAAYRITRWHMQPNYCEFWVEKRAITRMFYTILRGGDIDRQVRVVPNSGWTSDTYVKDNFERLYKYWNIKFKELGSQLGKKNTYPHIWVLYSGDSDPSGRVMDLNLVRDIMHFFRTRFQNKIMVDPSVPVYGRQAELSRRMSRIHLMRVAVTFRQIPEFGLEKLLDPSPDVIIKLEGGYDSKKGRNKKGDPNTERFKKMFKWYGNGTVFQIELDAMYARRAQFKKLLLDLVDNKFDNEIYQKHVVEKLEVERDLLTMRLKDKLINEKIELPGWKQIESRINIFKDILEGVVERSIFMDVVFSAMLTALTKQPDEGNEDDQL